MLYPLLKEISKTERIPLDWQEGLVVKLTKKGDTADCNNWRGITLLSCSDQIFTLRNIIKQCAEWQATVYLNFIDYEKAFDSIHRESLWALLHDYGIPQKIISLIKASHCRVIHDWEPSQNHFWGTLG